ncbi:MAG: sugar ABC transporter permease [Clostridia bacterium]|nr:sugar ABC transporter permease [Clostridia bacterium]
MGLYAGVAVGCVLAIVALKRETDEEKKDPHYKLAHYNEQPLLVHIKKNWMIYSFLIIPIAYFVIFRYAPMIGNVIAFRTYRGGPNFTGTGWRGFEYFSQFLAQEDFWRAFRNTLTLSLEYLALRFPLTLTFALLLNEMRNMKAKKFVQTVSYLPHFISTVILVGMVKEITSTNGPINMIIKALGNDPVLFVQEPEWFHTLYIVSGIWQGLGWGTILYLAAMTNINTELYEAAEIDGANRFRRVWHVTIPGILPTVCTLLVLDIGGIMGSNFEKVLLMYTPLTYETADVISTYVYRMGVSGGQFSFSTAVGLFEGIIGLVLVSIANAASRKLTDSSLW